MTTTAAATAAWRPRFHVTGRRNWINDPNGPIEHDGVYHLFFQAFEERPFWGPPAWGHVSSEDLVTWTRHHDALAPEAGAADADGAWSGCARVIGGRPAIYYTGVVGEDDERAESVCRAWGSADLLEWDKDPANPLVTGRNHHRDPFLWHDGERWQMLLGSGTAGADRHGQILCYDSIDGTRWTERGVFFQAARWAGALDLGEHWECPQLLVDGDAAALIVSCQTAEAAAPLMHAVAFTGTLRAGRFEGELQGLLDHGDAFYAPALMRDGGGRNLLWGWAQERLDPERQAMLSHAGALTLPREAQLAGGRLALRPIDGLERLRRAALPPVGGARAQMELRGPAWELEAPGGRARIAAERGELRIEVADGTRPPCTLAAPIGDDALRVFVDGSLIEAFAGDVALTTRAYPHGGRWERISGEGAVWALTPDAIHEP
jgi:beta-fructofuranosidase